MTPTVPAAPVDDLVKKRREELAPRGRVERRAFDRQKDPRSSLSGLALSGGGIRSATFALGVLQALGEARLLWIFDYLSTVSGGGFVGGWWSAWLSRSDRTPEDGIFPDDERLEPDRFPATLLDDQNVPRAPPNNLPSGTPDASRSAWLKDPIHHLRLFSNYLTPRKGGLSGDTWRAITVVSRNLVLTWAVLLPVLLAAVLIAQLYFAGDPKTGAQFVCSRPASAASVPLSDATSACQAALPPNAAPPIPHGTVVRERLDLLFQPLLGAALVIGALTFVWLWYGGGNQVLILLSFLAVGTGLFLLVHHAPSSSISWDRRVVALLWTGRSSWFRAGEIMAGVVLLVGWLGPRFKPTPPDRTRNLIVRCHATVLVCSTVFLLILLVAGFGHELVWFLFAPGTGAAWAAVRKAGGWGALAITVGSGLFAVLRAGPTTKGKDAAAESPKLPTKLLLTVAPPLVLAALVIAAATLGRRLYATRGAAPTFGLVTLPEVQAAVVGIALLMLYTVYERWNAGKHGEPEEPRLRRGIILSISLLVLAGLLFGAMFQAEWATSWPPLLLVLLAMVAFLLLGLRLGTSRPDGTWSSLITRAYAGSAEQQSDLAAGRKPRKHVLRLLAALAISTAALGIVLYAMLPHVAPNLMEGTLPALAAAGLGFGLVFLAVDLLLSRRDSDRSTWLAGLVVLASGALFALHYQPSGSAVTGFLSFGIAFSIFLIAAVVGLGWTTDPNLIALHNFYKARLVRAFLGASNTARKNVDITETAAGDDIPLKDLKNHEFGAPLQLLNTTLNLVGGRDLATAQRFAAPFTLSSEICGSARTGYHRTQDYMDGSLSLGTAVATSGAAVSTNMGSKTMSSALSLLLALFNVRLGIWAPTPNKERWYERHPRLWPFYLLREALSQTNDLGPYCYLTDGGHFDNTGLYALVERGCRYIMVLDDGADVLPCFSDMGEAIRRCRIDFGAEITFTKAVDRFLKAKDHGLTRVHYARGTIRYEETHLRMLGWSDQEIAANASGSIVWIKPTVTKGDSVDVRQYKLENAAFPQQTTADQWYDESQFESYRVLGYQSVMTRLSRIAPDSIQSLDDIDVVFRAF